MVFYLIGLGLGDPTDVSVRGLQIIKSCERVHLEAYTSIINGGKEGLEQYYGREVIIADREQVEQSSDDLFAGAGTSDVALLVVGDPLGATTHTDLKLRAHQLGIPMEVVSNASIMNAVGCCGLRLNRFGETVSIPFWQDGWEPISFCDKINRNLKNKLHTLCLLDIKVKEQSLENLLRGRKIFDPPRYMRVHQAAQQLLTVIQRQKASAVDNSEKSKDWLLGEETQCVAIVRVGTASQQIVKGMLKDLGEMDLGEPLHSLVVCGDCEPREEEALSKLSAYFTSKKTEEADRKKGVFHIVGLGLGHPDNVTVKGLEIIKNSSEVFLNGSSIFLESEEAMRKMFERKITVIEKSVLEKNAGQLLDRTQSGDVTLLVGGDPFEKTVHTDLAVQALNRKIPINIVHNASILNAVGCCGLQLYSFGETVTIDFMPEVCSSGHYYDAICSNMKNGWHTLCLLETNPSEKRTNNCKKEESFMSVSEGAKMIIKVINDRAARGQPTPVIPEQLVIGIAQVGRSTQQLRTCSIEEMANINFGGHPQALVIIGDTHPMEDEYIDMFRV